MKIAIIGAGISGLSMAHLLKDKGYDVTLYERNEEAGGLIRCKRVEGSLYHICGGHVFNSINVKMFSNGFGVSSIAKRNL